MNTVSKKDKSIPYAVIVSASGGDADAINAVLEHYRGYMTVLATRQLHDDFGNFYLCVDEWIRRRLETKLISAILNFNAA